MVVFMDQLAQQTPPMPTKLPVIGQVTNLPSNATKNHLDTGFDSVNLHFGHEEYQMIMHSKIFVPKIVSLQG